MPITQSRVIAILSEHQSIADYYQQQIAEISALTRHYVLSPEDRLAAIADIAGRVAPKSETIMREQIYFQLNAKRNNRAKNRAAGARDLAGRAAPYRPSRTTPPGVSPSAVPEPDFSADPDYQAKLAAALAMLAEADATPPEGEDDI